MKKKLLPIALLIAAAVPFVSQAQNLGEFYGRPSYWRPTTKEASMFSKHQRHLIAFLTKAQGSVSVPALRSSFKA
jgi:hypothetical protein